MNKLASVVNNLMLVIKGNWGRHDQEILMVEDLFANIKKDKCNCVEIKLELSKIRGTVGYITFGKKLKKVKKKFQ